MSSSAWAMSRAPLSSASSFLMPPPPSLTVPPVEVPFLFFPEFSNFVFLLFSSLSVPGAFLHFGL